MKGMGGHHRGHRGKTNTWLTPPHVLKALGPFDLDPCAAINQPWPTAKKHFTRKEDGLKQPWGKGSVFCNPPYGPDTKRWLQKCAEHNNGITLVFARTETAMFHEWVWNKAASILFLLGRFHFYDITGREAVNDSGAPSVLIAYGAKNTIRLRRAQRTLPGKLIYLQSPYL